MPRPPMSLLFSPPPRGAVSLTIVGQDAASEMWLFGRRGLLRAIGVGDLRTALPVGEYVVEFELGGPAYLVALQGPLSTTEELIRAGPTCERPPYDPTPGTAPPAA